ncbi:integral membrane protein [Fusarium heterosporum]|uniref:Integral membrane protein n=1 Tax=Fusarium heterosporum TaxID=42747 RepID=A0A8H5TTC8_FUSHE|nr:integral membrane protein [Fusarium heterosporum]
MVPAPPSVVNKDPERVAESQTALIVGVITTVNLLALLVVGARTYIRVVISKSPGVQDALMVLSAIPYGLGKHEDTIERPDLTTFNKYGFIHTIVPLLGGIGLLKISVALELIKYNGNSWRWYNITLWCLIAFVIAYTIEAWCSFIFYCNPVAKQWDRSLEGTCYPVPLFITFGLVNSGRQIVIRLGLGSVFSELSTAFNIFTDVAFATLPIPIVWSLKMPLKTRIYLVVVLSLGYLAAVMGVVKSVAQVRYKPANDNTYHYDIRFWGLLQLSVGIIAACAPSLRPLVKNILQLKSTAPAYDNPYYGQRQRSLPLSDIDAGNPQSRSREAHLLTESNNRSSRRTDDTIRVERVFELKSSSQVSILSTNGEER